MLTKAQIKTEEMNAKIKEMAGTSMAANFSMDGAAPPMVETVARAAADLGARPEDVHADPFYSVHELQEKGLLP